jgi:hypothetical protein
VFVLVAAVGLIGFIVSRIPGRGVEGVPVSAATSRAGFESISPLQPPAREEVEPDSAVADANSAQQEGDAATKVLRRARSLIREKRYDDALDVLNAERPLLKENAEAYFLIGKILERKNDFNTARDFYNAALNRNPAMSEAHWGFATSSEALGDLESALGAMRSYLHTERDADPMRLRINQARAAIWEWESRLGRGPWGPTRGIPPGFVPEDLKRDGRGVGVKMPLLETLKPDGTMKSEVKSANKVQIYPRP